MNNFFRFWKLYDKNVYYWLQMEKLNMMRILQEWEWKGK